MKYEFILNNLHQGSISSWCRVFNVSRQGFYSWLKRPLSLREIANQQLDSKIKKAFDKHKARYGAPRITQELKATGESASQKRIARRMQVLQLKAKQARKYRVTTDSQHKKPVAPNLLKQDFVAHCPNQKWVGDITYLWTQSGWLYLATVMDLHSRKIIGWSMSNRINKELVCDALLMAIWRRHFPKNVIVHTDRGSQYCSDKYQQLLLDNQLICSMSGKGNCYDNSAMESFFHTLKVECTHDYHFLNREEAKQTIFDYIETYYNRIRRHSNNGYLSPDEFELNGKRAS